MRLLSSPAALGLALGVVSLTVLPLRAQDARTVTEPRMPPTCTTLLADLTSHNGTLSDAVERHYRDTDRIEKAMRHCGSGTAVVLRAGENGKSVFLIGPMRLSAGVTLVVESQVAVWGSRDPRNYDVAPGSCGLIGTRGPGCRPLITVQDAPRAGIMGDGVIDGRGGARLLLAEGKQGETWWELAHRARVEHATPAVAGLVEVRRSNDFTLYRTTLRNAPGNHVTTAAMEGFTAWAVRIDAPKWARNTGGIEVQDGSSNISIVDSLIRAGGDNIAAQSTDGFSVSNMTVRNMHFYNGHGMTLASQTAGGVRHVLVSGLVIDGAENGLRLESNRNRGGVVDAVAFESVCMRGVPNPIVFDPIGTTAESSKAAVYRDIHLRSVHSIGSPGSKPHVTLAGFDTTHPLEASLENVVIEGIHTGELTASHAVLTLRGGNLNPGGDDVRTTRTTGGAGGLACVSAFTAFPAGSAAPVSAGIVPPEDKTFYVAADGTGDYATVQAALDRVPATGGLVLVAPGVYRERLFIRQPHTTLKSAAHEASRTAIVYDLSRGTQGPAEGFATVRVTADDFSAENITFENDFNRTHPQETQGLQARALALLGDRNVLRNVRILGNQNTLYLGARNCGEASGMNCEATRSYFHRSVIAGNVDFIYGDGTAFFDDCEIHSTAHAGPGFLTAQGKHYESQPSQFIFRNARLTAEPGVKNVYLGRPWRDYASVIFLNPQIGAHIGAAGWREWHPGETHRLATAFYRTWNASGPGGPTASAQLSDAEAGHYAPREALAGKDGWNPAGPR